MKIKTLRFGELDIPENKIINMAKPILGFEQLKQFCIIEGENFEPFLWFQSVEEPTVAFIIVNPILFCHDYKIEVNPKEIEELDVADVKTVETYAIVSIPSDPRKMSVNLQGPILINTVSRLAKQLVLVNTSYKVKNYIINETSRPVKESRPKELARTV